ncbi:MAG: glycerol-3-phosphate dehydrogenase [Proteobacteria bacterium]|nr:glycerol-3-phosphate dehydrogenase [Pseudomonadota bacterium]
MTTVTILGAGVMGSAMVLPFSDRGMTVRLVGTHLDEAIVESVKAKNFHPKLNVTLPKGVSAYHHHEFAAALGTDTDFILLGVASAGVDWAIEKLAGALKRPVPVVMITKGMSPEAATLGVFPDVVRAALKSRLGFDVPVVAVGGPCIAGELAVRRQTGTVIVSHDRNLAEDFCSKFETEYYHPRPSTDMVGVEVCAAFKNFFAIAVGWAHGRMEVIPEAENKARNNNAAAILFDQAVMEMLALVKALGGSPESVWGMPGTGDLYVTCQAGRNSRLGNNLGRGLTYSQVKAGPMKDDTIEGAELGRAVAKSLRAMVDAGRLSAKAVPLTLALLDALTGDKPLEPPWAAFARGH